MKKRTLVTMGVLVFLLGIYSFPAHVGAVAPPIQRWWDYSIYGYAKESGTSTPLVGATVKVYKNSVTYVGSTTTTSTGHFSFGYRSYSLLDSFKVVIQQSGYDSASKTKAAFISGVNMGTIYLVKQLVYSITGCVRDAEFETMIPDSTVNIFAGSSLLGQASTSSTTGEFSFTYTTSSILDSFTAEVSKSHYITKQQIATSNGVSCDFGDIFIDRQPRLDFLIEKLSFDYLPEWYTVFWTFDPNDENVAEYYDLSMTTSGIGRLSEAPGAYDAKAFVFGDIDLSSWTGVSDLTLRIKMCVSSSYYGSGDITHIDFGLADSGRNILWSDSRSWKYTQNTGFWTIESTVPYADLAGVDEFLFYWGYHDMTYTFYNVVIQMDEVEVYGDKYPEGKLVNTNIGTTSSGYKNPEIYTYENNYDSDDVIVSYGTAIYNANSLGVGLESDPSIHSAIDISLNPDMYEGTLGSKSYNLIDSLRITITVGDGGDLERESVECSEIAESHQQEWDDAAAILKLVIKGICGRIKNGFFIVSTKLLLGK